MNAAAYRVDGALVDAEAFYAVACDPRRSVVVEACAGAGKTWMLVSRVLRALLDGAEPQQILAITFTRKAAGEMRERLDDWLGAFADPLMDDGARAHELRLRGLGVAEAARLAPLLGALQARLLDGARAVDVRTFHGWFAQLVSHAPLQLLDELALPPCAELVEDVSSLRAELLRRFHRVVQGDDALRAHYLALVRSHRRSGLLQWLDAAWRKSTELECAIAAGTLDDSVPSAATLWPLCAGLADPRELLQREPLRGELDRLARALGALPKSTPQNAAARLRAALEAAAAGDLETAFSEAWGALFTKDGAARKHLGGLAATDTAGVQLRLLRAMCEQQAAHDDHRRMAALARVLLAEFARLKHQRGLMDMADLERAALRMLGDSALAGWVQERLDQRLRHVLIDEFQDTSPLQWQALHGWLSSYAGAAGRRPSVFVVGDPKQSIYRFRRAEPRVFEAAREFVVEGLAGQVLECDHTRRNAPAVLAALNAVFDDAARVDAWTPFRTHTSSSTRAGSVLALPAVARPPPRAKAGPAGWRDSLTEARHEAETVLREQEAAWVAGGIAELVARHGVAPGEVMVLSRRRAMLRLVAAALARAGLPFIAPESLALADSPEALDAAALLDALASPAHDLSLARALKSPLFGAADADLLWLKNAAHGAPWLAALLAAREALPPALARAQRLLAGWRQAAAALPPHDLLDRIVDEGEWPARLVAVVPAARRAGALQALQAVLAAALAHDGGRYPGVYNFVRALKAGVLRGAPAAPADAVRLLTVHGAKGLEARAVFVVDADPEARNPDRATLAVHWPVHAAAPERLAFVHNEARVPPSLAPLMEEEFAARAREELNGLYVAMTRAREWLVFSRTEPHHAGAGRSWWQRVQALAQPWEPAPTTVAMASTVATTATTARETAPCTVPLLPTLLRRSQPGAPTRADNPAAARLGQAVHRALEWLGQPGAAAAGNVGSEERIAHASMAAATAFDVDAGAVRAYVQRILASPDCARFFGGAALRWAGNEVPLADAGGVLRLDRLVRLGDIWWVLDYKLASRAGDLAAYREQMARYIAGVQAAQPGAVVRGGFITGQGVFVEA